MSYFHFFILGAPVCSCGFFKHPQDPRYGASPDGIGEAFAVEVKTEELKTQTCHWRKFQGLT